MSAVLIPGVKDIRGLAAGVPIALEHGEAADDWTEVEAAGELAVRHMRRLCEMASRSIAEASCKAEVLAIRLGDFERADIGRAECALIVPLARDLRALAEGAA